MDPTISTTWSAAWAWSLPLIIGTVVFHAFGLGFINERVTVVLNGRGDNRAPYWLSMLVTGGTALCATCLHGFEGMVWATAYRLLGALPDKKSAMLFSLNAMTTYGHADLHLNPHWLLMGTLEALDGWILFGLTTAFMFTVIQKVWPHTH